MKKIPTFKVTNELAQDLQCLYGIDTSRESNSFINYIKPELNVIILTQEEYDKITGTVLPDLITTYTSREQYISAKYIGVKRSSGIVDVYNTFGKLLETCINENEFNEKYFVEAI